jgi:hypothetical protein
VKLLAHRQESGFADLLRSTSIRLSDAYARNSFIILRNKFIAVKVLRVHDNAIAGY